MKNFDLDKRKLLTIGLVLLLLGVAVFTNVMGQETPAKEVSLSEVVAQIDADNVEKATLDDTARAVELELKEPTEDGADAIRTNYPALYGTDLSERLLEADIETTVEPLPEQSVLTGILFSLIPVVIIIAFLLWFIGRQGRGMGVGKMGKKKGGPVEVPATRFSDIAGAEEAVTDLAEVVDFLHNPDRFLKAGAKVPHGYLLVGPPGTGKTLIARAVAGEAGVPFFALSGSDFVEVFVGVGPSRMRDVFQKAREAGRAIIFIDEIDAVGKSRSSGPSNGATEEREATLNALLVEMDGFEQTGIIVLAATNRSDVLDPALLRPGRFDRKITVPAPDRAGREKLFELYAKGRTFVDEINWASFARRTPGLTGADISFLMNEAALESARNGRTGISSKDIDSALATAVLGRERRSAVITERDRTITAWHEAGHAILALLQEDADDPVSVTIIPRGEAGGVTWMGGNDNSFLTRKQAKSQLVVALGGRAAEERLLGGDFTQGAQGDLASATDLATRMVANYGMSETGRLTYLTSERLSVGNTLDDVNGEVNSLLNRALEEARSILDAHAPMVKAVVEELLDAETLSLEDLVRIQLDVEGKLAEAVVAKELKAGGLPGPSIHAETTQGAPA